MIAQGVSVRQFRQRRLAVAAKTVRRSLYGGLQAHVGNGYKRPLSKLRKVSVRETRVRKMRSRYGLGQVCHY